MFNVLTATPREIESYLRETVRKSHGDVAENGATINASRGYYSVSFMLDSGHVEFSNFRRKDVKRIAKAIRAMKWRRSNAKYAVIQAMTLKEPIVFVKKDKS